MTRSHRPLELSLHVRSLVDAIVEKHGQLVVPDAELDRFRARLEKLTPEERARTGEQLASLAAGLERAASADPQWLLANLVLLVGEAVGSLAKATAVLERAQQADEQRQQSVELPKQVDDDALWK